MVETTSEQGLANSFRGSRVPALDGMRAVFVLGVIAFHLWADTEHWEFDPGSLGVIGFFALSGYLITRLLLDEHRTSGVLELRKFCARRMLRLLPALGFFLGVWLVVSICFPHGQFLTTVPSAHGPGNPISWITALEAVVAACFSVTNWMIVTQSSLHLWYGYSPLGHLWTLAVEEQFYVLWAPLMLLLLRLRRSAAVALTAGIAMVSLFDPLVFSSASVTRLYFSTDTRCAALFCGALCAFVAGEGGWRVLRRARWAPAFGILLLVMLGYSAFALRHGGDRAQWNTGLIVGSVTCALAVVFVVERSHAAAGRGLSSSLLVGIGKRSYALYLWSYLLNTWLRDTGFFESFLVIGCSFLAAELSYRLIELPALRYKHSLAPHVREAEIVLSPPDAGGEDRVLSLG
jgi:peptidoglycan/LPS O-acetylase OafA/YrhL